MHFCLILAWRVTFLRMTHCEYPWRTRWLIRTGLHWSIIAVITIDLKMRRAGPAWSAVLYWQSVYTWSAWGIALGFRVGRYSDITGQYIEFHYANCGVRCSVVKQLSKKNRACTSTSRWVSQCFHIRWDSLLLRLFSSFLIMVRRIGGIARKWSMCIRRRRSIIRLDIRLVVSPQGYD